MTAADYVGIGTLITATAAAAVSIIVAIRQTAVKAVAEDTNRQVQTPNGATLGEIVAGNDLSGVQHAHDERPVT